VLKKPFPVLQLKEGLEWLYQCIVKAMKEFGKTEVIVGIEPTGHYWLNLAYFLDEKGIPLVMTKPMHVKRSKELDDNLPTKHDTKDALVTARLVKDGRFSYPHILKGMEAELPLGATFRSKLVEEQGAVRNQMIRWLDRYFPEFTQVFPSFGKMALAVLEYTPFPSDLAGKELEKVLTLPAKRGITIAAKAVSVEAEGPTLHWRNGRTTDGPYRNRHTCPPISPAGKRDRGIDRTAD